MSNFVIFDTAAGFLQWSGAANSLPDAIRAYAADVGLAAADLGELLVGEVTVGQLAAVDAWWSAGPMSIGGEFPAGLDLRVIDAPAALAA